MITRLEVASVLGISPLELDAIASTLKLAGPFTRKDVFTFAELAALQETPKVSELLRARRENADQDAKGGK